MSHSLSSCQLCSCADIEEARRREEEGETTPRASNSAGGVKQLPDFGQSPIDSQARSSYSELGRAESSGGYLYGTV